MAPSGSEKSRISLPQPLMKRPKSLADGLRDSTTSTVSASGSAQSSKSNSTPNSGVTMMQAIRNHLNTNLSEAYGMPPKKRPPSQATTTTTTTDRSSTATSFFRRLEDRISDEPKESEATSVPNTPVSDPRPHGENARRGESTPRMWDTTSLLLSHYNTFRSSIVSSSGTVCDEVLLAAQAYHKSMQRYLKLVDELPPCVRDTLDVKRLRQQLEQTIDLLEPVAGDSNSEQAILLLDNTLMLVKTILSDVQDLLLEHGSPTSWSAVDEDERDTDTSSVEYEIVDYPPSEHVEKAAGGAKGMSQQNLRRTKSSMAILSGFQKMTVAPSICTNDDASAESATLVDLPTATEPEPDTQRIRRPLLTQHPSQTQETLVDYSQNIAAVSESLDAFKSVPLFASRPRGTFSKPADTVNVTYGQDGTALAMSPAAIIEELCKEQSLAKIDKPGDGFIDIIFTNFRCWWTPDELLNQFWEAYDSSYQDARKLSIVLLVRRWVLSYWEPCDRVAIPDLRRFLGTALRDELVCSPIAVDILTRLQYYLEKGSSAVIRADTTMKMEKMPFKLLDVARDMPLARGEYGSVRLLEFNDRESCEELAHQLTLKESDMYLQLNSAEVVNCFVHPGADPKAEAKLRHQREFSSNLKRWATYSVLKRNNPAKRAKTFAFFARLAKFCLRLRNYSSAHSIYNGLESIHIDALALTKAELSAKGKRTMNLLAKFFSENKDISMHSSAMPTVPVMATYAGKLQRLKEVKASMYTASKIDGSVQLINISLFRGATRVIYAMESNQIAYRFKAHAPVQGYLDFLFGLVPANEEELHKRFLEVKQLELNDVQERKTGFFCNRLHSGSTAALSKI
ncbi:hypothetical protein M0805_005827 [Coniferiporia weirii]|nr:hypothetical protein M0805_005827 [Coniferiporia weirii]